MIFPVEQCIIIVSLLLNSAYYSTSQWYLTYVGDVVREIVLPKSDIECVYMIGQELPSLAVISQPHLVRCVDISTSSEQAQPPCPR